MTTLQSIPQPVLARVHALATAAGCQLVATADLAVASEEAGFAIPGGKGGWFCHTPLVAVARAVPRKRALEMAFTGDVIDAKTAAEWGLVNAVVPAAELDAACLDLLAGPREAAGTPRHSASRRSTPRSISTQAKAYAYAIEVMAASSETPDRASAWRRSSRSARRVQVTQRVMRGTPAVARYSLSGASCATASATGVRRVSGRCLTEVLPVGLEDAEPQRS